MTFQVHEAERLSTEQMREFLQGTRRLELALRGKAAVDQFPERVSRAQIYGLKDAAPGLICRTCCHVRR